MSETTQSKSCAVGEQKNGGVDPSYAVLPPIIELTTELSELSLFCPFCGEQVYDWSVEDNISPCKHLISSGGELTPPMSPPHQLGDVIFCICDSGPRPDVQFLMFRDVD